ncbi:MULTISPECIES: hypothetical protein [unclassified Shewanella]|uniref:helix-turn-helix transcriptional regulator n=1 Tax=unclassified Shewanella TaxID=196818 RepID=UPI000C840FEA|nr:MULTISPECIES: hypothetical protein [unclassified Shewanella]MDO6620542.1 hypothetical protein [Shewanella sp. 6_MG-2023]PMG51939.1 hypothetical protein BCU91_15925 [Shewanella sp. 10N.286.52.B9]
MKVSSILNEFSRTHNITDTMFVLDINSNMLPSGFSKLNQVAGRTHILASSVNAIKYSKVSRKKWAKKDHNTEVSLKRKYHTWDYSDWPQFKVGPNDDIVKFGYQQKVTVEVPCMMNPNWVGRFYFMVQTNNKLADPNAFSRLYKDLTDIHYMLLQSSMENLNPFLDYGLIKSADIAILYMMANGHDRESIAKAAHLSARGVDYRILKLKKLLGASNCSSLIHSAYNNFLIQ